MSALFFSVKYRQDALPSSFLDVQPGKKFKFVQKELKKIIKTTEYLHSKLSKSPVIRPPSQGGMTTHYVSIKDASVPEKLYLYCDWEGSDNEPAPQEKDGTILDISDSDIYDNELDLRDLFICDEESAMFVVGK